MARRLALVPESWLRNMNAQNAAQPDDPKPEPYAVSVHDEPSEDSSLVQIAEVLPKRLRTKARMLLHYLSGHITLSKSQQILYPSGEVGSHIVDLLRYFTSPLPTERPLDAPKFQQIMEKAGVPRGAVARRQLTKPIAWRSL